MRRKKGWNSMVQREEERKDGKVGGKEDGGKKRKEREMGGRESRREKCDGI